MKKINISINPTYKCNFSCDFCYLKNLSANDLLDLNTLKQQLQNISKEYIINDIDIYGGQIFLLSDQYLNKLFNICFQFVQNISIITNMSIWKQQIFKNPKINIITSWDYIYRQQNQIILNNIKKYISMYNSISIILTSPQLYNHKEKVTQILNNLNNINVCIKPYYKTQQTKQNLNFEKFQKFFLYLYSNLHRNINLIIDINKVQLLHIFISPKNELLQITYNKDNQQYFKVINNINDLDFNISNICMCCSKYNNCLIQHEYMCTSYDCCGQYKLMNKLDELQKPHISWKTRRKIYYLTNELTDINLQYSYNNQNIIQQVIDFFYNGSKLIYPAKSYYVAIIYAYLLSQYFGQDFYDMLNREDLLNYDDQYFVIYSKSKQIYDKILKQIYPKLSELDINDTAIYFYKEFLIKKTY